MATLEDAEQWQGYKKWHVEMSQTFGASTNQLPHATHNRYCKPSSTCMPSNNTNTKHWLPQTSCLCFRNNTNLKPCFILPTSKLETWTMPSWSSVSRNLALNLLHGHNAHINTWSLGHLGLVLGFSKYKIWIILVSSPTHTHMWFLGHLGMITSSSSPSMQVKWVLPCSHQCLILEQLWTPLGLINF